MKRGILPLVSGLVLLLSSLSCTRESPRLRGVPTKMLWAWESAQDLRFLNHGEGVAFLVGELHLEGAEVRWVGRRSPLHVNPETPLIAVLRVETRQPALNPAQAQSLVERALKALPLPQVVGLQIDFDAKDSERPFYAETLKALRLRMPASAPLSITALASWCLDDPWLSGAGLAGVVDEAVPMLFRMGVEDRAVRLRLRCGGRLSEPLARRSCGLSTDEPLLRLRGSHRTYVFHPGPWTEAAWTRITRELP